MRKFITALILMISSIINAQENYTEAGLRLTLQKLSQTGISGITYVNEENLVSPLNITSNENPGPGISGFYNWIFAYNRLLLGVGGEIGTKHLYAEISDNSKYLGTTERRVRTDKFVLGVPMEAGFLAHNSRKGKTRIYTSVGLLTDFTLRNTSEGSIPGHLYFTEKYCYNKTVTVIPYFKVRFKMANVSLAYTHSRTSRQFGNAKIKFSENSFSLILIKG
jgi:hypothetical protein